MTDVERLGPFTDNGTLIHPKRSTGARDIITGGITKATADIILNADGSAEFNVQKTAVDFIVHGGTISNLIFVDGSTDFIGNGTSSPATAFHIVREGTNSIRQDRHDDTTVPPQFEMFKSRGTAASPTIINAEDGVFAFTGKLYDGAGYIDAAEMQFLSDGTPGTNDMPGRWQIATTPDGAAALVERFRVTAEGAMQMLEISGDPTTIANRASLYAKAVTASSEMFVQDEAGNATQISPHGFNLFEPDIAHTFPWSYSSKNDFLGVEINVDMYGAIKEIEALSGKTFIHERTYAKKSWGAAETRKKQKRAQEAKSPMDRDPNKNYTRRQPPKWMKDRGVNL